MRSSTGKRMMCDVNNFMSQSGARNTKSYQAFSFLFVMYVVHLMSSDIKTASCTCAACESLGSASLLPARGR